MHANLSLDPVRSARTGRLRLDDGDRAAASRATDPVDAHEAMCAAGTTGDSHRSRAPSADADGWALLVPSRNGLRVVAIDQPIRIGRGRDCDLRLDVAGIDDRHCRLRLDNRGLAAVDLGSSSGTRVRGRTVGMRPVALASGDVIHLGRLPLVVVRDGTRRGMRWLGAGGIGSGDEEMWRVFHRIGVAAVGDCPVWIAGESGCGKELAARLLHGRSPRSNGPLYTLNCGALHEDSLEAELFGAARGAYTGCVEERKGAFERADGGTLFLDEIGELSPAAQAALLRVLEVGEVQPLGGVPRRVDVRVVCASHRDLAAAVRAGRFRLDLLYRLAVHRIELPPLRARPCDLLPLFDELCEGVVPPAGAAALLARHDWPGNVRELRNVARRLAAAAWSEETCDRDLVEAMGEAASAVAEPARRWRHGSGAGALGLAEGGVNEFAPEQQVDREQRVAEVVAACATTAEAWRRSGLPRTTFFRYLRRLRANV